MSNRKIKSQKVLATTPRLSLMEDEVIMPDGKEKKQYKINTLDGVLVVPIKVAEDGKVNFVMIEQYRHPIGRRQLEFPGGAVEGGEEVLFCAERELYEETGYRAATLKSIYMFCPAPSMSSFKTYVYLAVVTGVQDPLFLEDYEIENGFEVVEKSAEELWKMIRENEITDGKTLAALSVVLLQSPKASEYMESMI